MKVLILGAKGMLGQALAKTFKDEELYLWDREELDITDFDFTRYKIVELGPDLIINAAGYTNVDGAEKNYDLAKLLNGDAPINLARVAEDVNATFVHYSTDYVFDGIKDDGYNENDEPNPISKYGESKAFGEAVLAYCEKCYLIRTSRLFGFSGTGKKSFVEKMLELGEKKELLEIVDEEISKPTFANDLAGQTRFLVEQEYPYGIYHVSNSGECTWYDFAQEIFRVAGNNIKLVPVSGDKFQRAARRPLNSSLINEKLPPLRSWQEALSEFLLQLEQSKRDERDEQDKQDKQGERGFDAEDSSQAGQLTEEEEKELQALQLKQEISLELDAINALKEVETKLEVREENGVKEVRLVRQEKPLLPKELEKTEAVTAVVPPLAEALRQVVEEIKIEKTEKPEPMRIAVEKTEEKIVTAVNIINQKKNMKGIILSGGKGTRLYPLTKVTSKQLLPVYDKPMIMYPLETLIGAGIKEILIIVAPEYAGHYLQLLGSGKELGVKLTYEIQDEPRGLPEAFVIGEKFIDDDNVTLILGDNIFFEHDFKDDIQSFERGGRIFAVHVPDPERFGVVEFDENRKVVSIEEKPQKPKSNYAVPGIYIYDSRVCQIAKDVKPAKRLETEIVDIHRAYLAMNELDVKMVNGRWLDAGTFESLLKASNWIAMREYQKKMGYDENLLNKK